MSRARSLILCFACFAAPGLCLLACAPSPTPDAGISVESGASDSARQDHSWPDVQRPPLDAAFCADATSQGRCEGELLIACHAGQVETLDCSRLGRSCGRRTTMSGWWCLGADGHSCADWPCADDLQCGDQQICQAMDAGSEDLKLLSD